jgi:hypothetical protein
VFYYFGRKGRPASSYEPPEYDLVIEPFAGSMAYSLHWRPGFAIGCEANGFVVRLWRRLAHMSVSQIKTMQLPPIGTYTTDLYWMLTSSSTTALKAKGLTMTEFMYKRALAQQRMTVREQNYAENNVLYYHGDYQEAPDVAATWFIDPPYSGVNGGYHPEYSTVDYEELALWCLNRKGQLIVCEGNDGWWLPFKPLRSFRGVRASKGVERKNAEFVWSSETRLCRCGARFRPTNTKHVYCTSRCRVAAHRARRASRGGG